MALRMLISTEIQIWQALFIFLALLKYNWYLILYKFKMYMLIWQAYVLQYYYPHRIRQTCITSCHYHSIFVVRIFTVYSFRSFQVYNIVLSAVVNVWSIRFPELTHFEAGNLYSDQYLFISLSFQLLVMTILLCFDFCLEHISVIS